METYVPVKNLPVGTRVGLQHNGTKYQFEVIQEGTGKHALKPIGAALKAAGTDGPFRGYTVALKAVTGIEDKQSHPYFEIPKEFMPEPRPKAQKAEKPAVAQKATGKGTPVKGAKAAAKPAAKATAKAPARGKRQAQPELPEMETEEDSTDSDDDEIEDLL